MIVFNLYNWNKKNVALEPEEIAPWKLPRDRHATISVLKHKAEDLQAVDDYLSVCEKQFSVEYLKQMSGTVEQAWQNAMRNMNAELFPRGKNTLLECLQFGGNILLAEERAQNLLLLEGSLAAPIAFQELIDVLIVHIRRMFDILP